MEAADFSKMSTDMHQNLGRQIPDDTTAIKKSEERHFLKNSFFLPHLRVKSKCK
jgi:hypothetical protein